MNLDEQMHLLDDMVRSLAARSRPVGVDLDDACQEARLALWRALPNYDAARGDLRGFAFVVLMNHFRTLGARRARVQQQRMIAEAEFSGDYYAPQDGTDERQMAEIERAVKRLPAAHRFVVLSAYGMTHEGDRARIYLGKRMGVSQQKLAEVLRRALKTLEKGLRSE